MKMRHLLVEAYLHVLAFALLCMGAVSLVGFFLVDEPTQHSVVLLPDSALLALLTGALLLAASRRAWRSLLLSGALLIALIVYTLLHNYLAAGADQGQSLVSGFLRVRSSLAVTLLAVAAAICLGLGSKPARWLAQLIGAAVMLLAVVAHLGGQQPGASLLSLGFKYSASHIANLFILSLGLAAILHSRLPIDQRGTLDRMSQSAGLFGILLTCIGWYLLSVQAIEAISRESDLLLSKVQTATTRSLDGHMALIQRLAERWQAMGTLPSPRLWQQEADSYLRDFPGLESLALLDPAQQPLLLKSRGEGESMWLSQFLAASDNRAWLKHVLEDGHVHLSNSYRHEAATKPRVLIGVPLSLPGAPIRLLVASLDVQSVMASVLGMTLSGFIVRVYERDHALYDSNQNQQASFNTPVGERLIPIAESHGWRIVAYLNRPGIYNRSGYLPTLVMLFGLTLSYLLMLSQRLAWLAHERSHKLASINDQLQSSLAGQARVQRLNRRIMQFTLDMLCSIDAEGRFREVSPSCEKLLGYKPEELIGRHYMELVLPEDHALTEAKAAAIMAGQSTHSFRNRYRHRDGQVLHILWSADWSQEEQTLFAVAHDITALVQNERYTQTQRDILGMIATEQPLHDILEAICLMVEAQQPKVICSVLLLDADGRCLHTEAAPSLPAAYNHAIDGTAIGPHAGSCGTAAYRQTLVVAEDIQLDPLWQDYRELAQAHGLRACWSFPLLSQQGHVLGTLAIYLHMPGRPSSEQTHQLANAAQLAAIAIARSQDRQRLQESEQRFRSLFTFNPDPVFSIDLAGRFVSMNGAGIQLTGISEPDILGRYFADLIVAEDRERTEQHFANACLGIPQRYETNILAQDGQRLALDVTHLPIMVEGKITGVFGIAKDVSEREQALQQVQRLAERLSTTLSSISDAFFTLDSEWCFTYINPEAERQLDISAAATLGQCVWTVFPGSFDSEFGQRYRQALQDNQPCHFETFYKPFQKWFEIHAYPSEEGLAVYFQDVSERRHTQERLQQTLLELERSNRELEEFAFVASHDLQEPLRKIQAFSERLGTRSDRLDADGRDYLQRMTAAAARMQALIIDLLDYSRVNSRGLPLQQLQLDKLLDEVLQDLEAALEQSHAVIQRGPLPQVLGDASQLRRVLQNLLSNALKFQKPGEHPQISIYAEYSTGARCTLCIADNGIGFEEKYLDRIFNPFQRLHGREAYAGTGIGLAIVKKIVERHGAYITASSEPGAGSIFRITFPAMARKTP
ncbi:PAS domain S-box protein [Pseudomonas sp.]|uniref:PAS domain S-box protein n=1 Tax=Pseudomonas sp. TaxID=306 RepID=UPI003BB4AAD9